MCVGGGGGSEMLWYIDVWVRVRCYSVLGGGEGEDVMV